MRYRCSLCKKFHFVDKKFLFFPYCLKLLRLLYIWMVLVASSGGQKWMQLVLSASKLIHEANNGFQYCLICGHLCIASGDRYITLSGVSLGEKI